jgi:peptide-methionine (S)-S-oxide reductase
MAKETIVLGGGCFWCTEAVLKMVPGVLKIISGYAGGSTENPTYEQVCMGDTGHAEVVKVEFDTKKVSLERILEIFFAMHDPTSLNRQGGDVGTQYRSLVLYTSERQEKAVLEYIDKIRVDYEKPIVTEVAPLLKFYPAEDYHQEYFGKNPHAPYCMMVISPKVKKVKEEFGL